MQCIKSVWVSLIPKKENKVTHSHRPSSPSLVAFSWRKVTRKTTPKKLLHWPFCESLRIEPSGAKRDVTEMKHWSDTSVMKNRKQHPFFLASLCLSVLKPQWWCCNSFLFTLFSKCQGSNGFNQETQLQLLLCVYVDCGKQIEFVYYLC